MYERMLNKQEMPSLEEMTAFCGCRTNSIKPFMINFKIHAGIDRQQISLR